MDTLPQGLASLPNELILIIFEFIIKITDNRQFLKTCRKYNIITKELFHNYEKYYTIPYFDKIYDYCVEKFTLELCHDKYFEMIPERYIIPSNSILEQALVSFNCLPLLKLAKENGCNLYNVNGLAASNGNLEILKWAKGKGFEFYSRHIVYAIKNGHLEVLKWMANNYDVKEFIGNRLCDYSAFYGQLDMLIWGHENGYLWDEGTCSNAASNGHLSCLKYLRENNCEWDNKVYLHATKYKHTELLNWAIENGCPV